MEGSAYENRLDDPSANAHAGAGTEKLAFKLSDDGKTLSLLYSYNVGLGATEPIPLAVHSKTASYIVADGQQILGETAVILDVKRRRRVLHRARRAWNKRIVVSGSMQVDRIPPGGSAHLSPVGRNQQHHIDLPIQNRTPRY
jgi:hypothetical protein